MTFLQTYVEYLGAYILGGLSGLGRFTQFAGKVFFLGSETSFSFPASG